MRILWLLLIERRPRADDDAAGSPVSLIYRIWTVIVSGLVLAAVTLFVLWVRAR